MPSSRLRPRARACPFNLPTDRAALDLALGHLGTPEPATQRIVWIENTLSINRIAVSSSIKDQIASPAHWKLAEGPFPAEFDAGGDLHSPL